MKPVTVQRDDFEYWLFKMDDRLEALFNTVPENVAADLDYSPPSLSTLEQWLLSAFPDVESILADEHQELLDDLSRYVGETVRKALGGKWNIDLERPENAYFQIPVVEVEGSWSACPVTLVTASLDRRRGDFMETVLRNYIEDYGRMDSP
jgi:hypothetical protein